MWKFYTVTILITVSSSLFAEVKNEDIKKSLTELTLARPLINEVVTVTPIENHHFNLEAPQSCGKDGTLDPSARKINCQFHKAGENKILVSVCDNQKNYCKQETIKVSVIDQASGTPRMKEPASQQTRQMQKEMKKKLMGSFVEIKPEQLKLQMLDKKGALVLVSTDWCPPCNIVKEFLLPTTQFEEATKDLLLVYVDGDSPNFSLWKPYLNTFYYPSFVFLNRQGEKVDLLTGYNYFFEFSEWLDQAQDHHSDHLARLEARIRERSEGSYLRKIKDLFQSQESVIADQKRWVGYLEKTSQQTEALRLLEIWKSRELTFKELFLKYTDLWFGKKSSEIDGEIKQKKMDELAKLMLTTHRPADLSEEWIISYLLSVHCGEQQIDPKLVSTKNDPVVSAKHCQQLQRDLVQDMQQKKIENTDKLLITETSIQEAAIYKTLAKISESQGIKSLAEQGFKKCSQYWAELKEMSPLGEQSRASRIESLSCLSSIESPQKLTMIQTLIKDFPFDATFHRYLASHYLKSKQFDKALEANSKAIQFSYGDSWAKNRLQRVSILQAKGEKNLALQSIEESLKEVSLDRNDNKRWWLNSLRAQQKQLRKEIKL